MQDTRIEKKSSRRPNSSVKNSVSAYVDNVKTMSKSTAYEYLSRLNNFKSFLADKYNNQLGMDVLLSNIEKGKEDPYNILNGYAAYLRDCNVSTITLKQRIVTVKNFFEYCDIDISPRRFKLKVKLPKVIRKKKHFQRKILSKY